MRTAYFCFKDIETGLIGLALTLPAAKQLASLFIRSLRSKSVIREAILISFETILIISEILQKGFFAFLQR